MPRGAVCCGHNGCCELPAQGKRLWASAQEIDPARRQVHVDEYPHKLSLAGKNHLTLFGALCSVLQRLHNICPFQIWVVGQHVVDAVACADLTDHHADGHAHSANARLPTHHVGLLGNAIEFGHGDLLSQDFLEIVRLQAWLFQNQHFPRLKWHLVRAPRGNDFVIGDRPVAWGWEHWTDPPPAALQLEGVMLLAPLTRSLALLACREEDGPPSAVFPTDINRAMLLCARKWVAGPNQKLLEQLTQSGRIH
jgi:hypothetical protein